ncbi:unnamed protein product [Adineta steineri]|uniref:Cadherin domain-containing protein n=1 Tax=Adineta steineri TaxID=433720 RepID=A0A814R1R0_9BILA|nr:unnamed protein product [Adineta steineri]CAF3993287.1 unnamed protein product [Adineta steineri]
MHLFYILLFLVLPTFIESRQQEVSLNEETPIGTIIFDLNTLSSSAITYQLLESSSLISFNSTTNLISISKRIDRDTLCPYDDTCSKCQITMKFYDMFYYDILLLIFNINDINDNPPIFSSNTYSISLTENNIPGIKIRLSKAEDIDCDINGVQLYELTYVLHGHVMISSINLLHKQQNQTINQPFYLFYDTNFDLYLIINQTLDRELQNEYIFTITANDYSHTISSKLTLTVLDVNDHIAHFSQSIYSINISYSTLPGTNLLKLTAYDPDLEHNARIYYSLLSIDGTNNKNDLFQINSHTGELRLISNLTQLESKHIFKLIIGASDGTNNAIPALATVYINIIQQSIITITFGSNRISKNASEVFIEENLPNSTFIAYITSDKNLQILPEGIHQGFFIQKLSENSLTLLTDRSYDREKQSSYDVFIRSGDNERNFRIIVTDINDCRPIWNTSLLNLNIHSQLMILTLNATDYDDGNNGKIGYRRKGYMWPEWIQLIENKLIINCTNETDNNCWKNLLNKDIFIDIEAYDYGKPELSSVMKIRLYRSSTRLMFIKYEYIIVSIACLLGILFVLFMICLCICYRKKSSKKMKEIMDDNSTKQKIIQTSSSEQSSSAGSLYGSEKSDNITLETAASCHLDMFLFSPKRTALVTDTTYPYTFLNKSSINQTDNLTNKLFHSIQNDLSLLTDTKQDVITNQGTYV